MIAQGYQESQLDQNAKSHVGAIGVMQVMPATGKELKVGDITQLEPNIHAGVKYIRFMMDQYYADEPMDRLNKGAVHVRVLQCRPEPHQQLRERAAKRGLDPNKWFNNVEVLAAESIGRETVQYVANIYKYYLAYQMYMEQQEQRLKAKQDAAGGKEARSAALRIEFPEQCERGRRANAVRADIVLRANRRHLPRVSLGEAGLQVAQAPIDLSIAPLALLAGLLRHPSRGSRICTRGG